VISAHLCPRASDACFLLDVPAQGSSAKIRVRAYPCLYLDPLKEIIDFARDSASHMNRLANVSAEAIMSITAAKRYSSEQSATEVK